MAKKSRKNEKAQHKLKGEIARAVFIAAESMGISDRELIERLVEQVSQRLKVSRSLPGMEDFVLERSEIPQVSSAEIKAKVEEVLAEVSPFREVPLGEETPPSSIELTPTARVVLERRYLAKDEEGRVVETPGEMFRRVARHIASADQIYEPKADIKEREEEFYQLMANFEFLPNSPTLMNAGRELGQLSACFVLPVEDSMESIFDAVKNTALIHKCLVPETLVMTDRGLIRLAEVREGSFVATETEPFLVTEVHNNGEEEVWEVVTERGFTLKGTADHRLIKINKEGEREWHRIGDLKPGDWLVLKVGGWLGGETKLPEFSYKAKQGGNQTSFKPKPIRFPKELSPSLAELIGLYIGDGSNHRDGIRFTIGQDDPELLDFVKRRCLELFGREPIVAYHRQGSVELSLLSLAIKEWFNFLGITKTSSREARIPEIILQGTEEIVYAFLRGLFTADGCVRKNGHITLSTPSPHVAEEAQVMMLHLGIPAQRKYYKSTNSFQLSICTKGGFKIFEEKIGFLSRRKQERLNSINPSQIFIRGEIIPHHLEDFFYVRVVSARKIGIRRVFDLGVPGKHTYLANGFISHNSGGGTGFSFSKLRPEGDFVRSTAGVASGPVSFIRAFDITTNITKQGGTRRGANMGILKVDHPDILKFITAKEDPKALTNFNISVAVNKDFMEAVKRGTDYDLINPRTKEVVGRLNAKEVFDRIIDMAWRMGDPGMVFLDRINQDNPAPHLGEIESTNPCGEVPLLPYESCNLGSINLSKTVAEKEGSLVIDWEKFGRVVKTAVRFLDNVIDVNKYPLPQIEERTKAARKIGLGVMGFADMLMKLGIPYDSEQALKTAESVMKFIEEKSTAASVELAKERGKFPAFEGSIYDQEGVPQVRNATRTTIAPTGTLSIIAGTSSGIEPPFALVYYRHVLEGEKLLEANPLFEEVARKEGFYSEQLMHTLAERGRVRGLEAVPEWVQRLFPTSHDISPEWHVKMQAAFQKHTDNAVSKTINMPNEATQENVAQAYMLAYEEGLKGITIYRDRSREAQVLTKAEPEKEEKLIPRERPGVTKGLTQRVTTGCGNLYITVNFDDQGNPFEVFSSLGKAGGCASAQLEGISRLCSLALRSGMDVESLVKQLKGIRCPSISWDKGHAVLSCADAISSVLEKYIKGEVPAESLDMSGNVAGQCPDCGSVLSYQEGCFVCPSCGYTKCG